MQRSSFCAAQFSSSSPTAAQEQYLNECQAWTSTSVNVGSGMIKDATSEMCSAVSSSSGVRLLSLRCATGPSSPCACGAGGNSNAPLAPRWIQISERRGLQETVLIPSLEDPCVDPIDVELPHCQHNTLHRRHSAACWLRTCVHLNTGTFLIYISNTNQCLSLIQHFRPQSARLRALLLIHSA